MRVSSPEVERGWPAPNASMSVVAQPARRERRAVQAPIVPAPITTTSAAAGLMGSASASPRSS
jgi:hypothetical protein